MKKDEIIHELRLNYYDLVDYLLEKYGPSEYDYYPNENCKSGNRKLTRTNEGLLCHHIDEDKGGSLSRPSSARLQPFEWQRKERLVYCNYLEHLILHIKIAILRQKGNLISCKDIAEFFTTGGINMICHDINSLFFPQSDLVRWRMNVKEPIKENYGDYIGLLQLLLCYIDQEYIGDRGGEIRLVPGTKFSQNGAVVELKEYDNGRRIAEFILPNNKTKKIKVHVDPNTVCYQEAIVLLQERLASVIDGRIIKEINNDLKAGLNKELYISCLQDLRMDFHGYGAPAYKDYYLDANRFGSGSLDEYITKAISFTSDSTDYEIKGNPYFWKGKIPWQIKFSDIPYFIRVELCCELKEDKEPYIVYKENGGFLLNKENFGGESNNFLSFRHGRILSTSYYYDEESGEMYSQYTDYAGTHDATAIVTLTALDYLRLEKYYYVDSIKELDGCFFEEDMGDYHKKLKVEQPIRSLEDILKTKGCKPLTLNILAEIHDDGTETSIIMAKPFVAIE